MASPHSTVVAIINRRAQIKTAKTKYKLDSGDPPHPPPHPQTKKTTTNFRKAYRCVGFWLRCSLGEMPGAMMMNEFQALAKLVDTATLRGAPASNCGRSKNEGSTTDGKLEFCDQRVSGVTNNPNSKVPGDIQKN